MKIDRALNFFAIGCGLGRSPVAPGTVGTLLGIPLAWSMSGLVWSSQSIACLLLAFLSVPVCAIGEKYAGMKDPHCVVADEYLTFPITMIGLPFAAPVVIVAFLTHRLFDITKPWPAHSLQSLPGGWGITVDDVVSSLYALAINHFLYHAAVRIGWL